MKTSDYGIALIKHFEGFSAMPYRCPAGYYTIGYGHVLKKNSPTHVNEAQAENVLRDDVRIAESAVVRLIHRALLQHQFDALVSFTFNLGAGALQRSQLRRVVNRGEDAAVPVQLARWVYAGGRKLPGLLKRRAAEGNMYKGNQ